LGEEEIAQTLTKAERVLLQYITRHHHPALNSNFLIQGLQWMIVAVTEFQILYCCQQWIEKFAA
jgi:hypothetical protein